MTRLDAARGAPALGVEPPDHRRRLARRRLLFPELRVRLALLSPAALAPRCRPRPDHARPGGADRIRRLLNVNSLNDGLATPIVLIAIAIAAADAVEDRSRPRCSCRFSSGWARASRWAGLGRCSSRSPHPRVERRELRRGLALAALPIMAYILARAGAPSNGFVAAFRRRAGLSPRRRLRSPGPRRGLPGGVLGFSPASGVVHRRPGRRPVARPSTTCACSAFALLALAAFPDGPGIAQPLGARVRRMVLLIG